MEKYISQLEAEKARLEKEVGLKLLIAAEKTYFLPVIFRIFMTNLVLKSSTIHKMCLAICAHGHGEK